MTAFILIIHIMLCVALVASVLLQRSEGGALGIGGGGGGGGLMSGRGAANFMTRTTAFLAVGFFITSIALSLIASGGSTSSVVDETAVDQPLAPLPTLPLAPAPDSPAEGTEPPAGGPFDPRPWAGCYGQARIAALANPHSRLG